MHRTILMWIGVIAVALVLISHPQVVSDLIHAFTDAGTAAKDTVSH